MTTEAGSVNAGLREKRGTPTGNIFTSASWLQNPSRYLGGWTNACGVTSKRPEPVSKDRRLVTQVNAMDVGTKEEPSSHLERGAGPCLLY